MKTVSVHHQTIYRYREAVSFAPHRLMLRPRESCNLRLIDHRIVFDPTATVTWANDVFGNAVAGATIDGASDSLIIESVATLELDAERWPIFPVSASAASFPFLLDEDDMTDLGALRLQNYLDSSDRLRQWVRSFVAADPTDTLSLLQDICAGSAAGFDYEVREDEGVQSPVETLDRGIGACRDFAVLFVDAVRSLGFGARVVSGYLYDPGEDTLGSAGAGSTHAWAEVFVPGAGWITFDPTNRSMGDFNLIPVAVARAIHQVVPISGGFVGPHDALTGMDVSVRVDGVPRDAA